MRFRSKNKVQMEMLQAENDRLQGRVRELIEDRDALRRALYSEVHKVTAMRRELEIARGSGLRDDKKRK
jgi:hypothetical protein